MRTITEQQLSCKTKMIGGDYTRPVGDTIHLYGTWREVGKHAMQVLAENPKRTYAELLNMVRNEGGDIVDGFIV